MIKYLFTFLFLITSLTSIAQEKVKTATWYGGHHHGKKMANGKIYNMYALTCAAHPKYKFGTKIKVTNIENGKSVIVTVTDRGGFYHKREFDLSIGAFQKIAPLKQGVVKIKFKVL